MLFCVLCLLPPLCQPAWAEYVDEVWRGSQFVAPLSVSVDDPDGSCWVADGDDGAVVRVGADGAELWRGTGFGRPSSLSANWGDGSCWVADADAGQVVHLAADGTELWRGAGFGRPGSLSANSLDGSCWVADSEGGQVVHLAADGTELWRGTGFSSPVSVSVLVWDGSCWVADAGSGEVVHLAQDGAELWRGGAFSSPVSVSVSMRDWTCWVADTGSSQIVHVATDGTELSRSGGFSSPVSVSTNAGEGTCWAADTDLGEVVLLGPDGGELWRGAGFANPSHLAANHLDWSCWVADTGNGQVVRLAYYYTLTFTGDSGQVAVNGVSHALPWAENIAIGSPVTVEALPDATSEFLGWSGDFSGTTNPMTITADADYIIGVELTGAEQAPVLAFTDVPDGYWAAEAIAASADAGIVSGYADGRYGPTAPVDRGSMAVYISRALAGGDVNVPDGPEEPTFPDVPTDHWAFKYIEYAVSASIVAGYGDGGYHADWPVTRGQMSVFIARAMADPTGDQGLQSYEAPATASFADVPEHYWCFRQVEFLAEHGVASGHTDGTYGPGGIVTRDQMAVYIARAFGLVG